MAIKNKKHISSALTTPTFSLPMSSSGIQLLDQDLTINGQTVSPTFRYEAKNATTGSWTSTVGENLTGAGSGGTVGKDTPFVSDDEAVNGDYTRRWIPDNNSFANITTGDFAIEYVAYLPSSAATSYICGKYGSPGAATGYRIVVQNLGTGMMRLVFYVYLSDGSLSSYTYIDVPADNWYHVIFFLDRDVGFKCYANGGAYSNGLRSTTPFVGSMSSEYTFALGANYSTAPIGLDVDLAYVAMWQKDDWFDTNLQADIAKERFYKLCGVYPQIARGTALPEVVTRSTTAYLDKDVSGVRKLFQVGANWMRVCKRTDSAAASITGFLPEFSATNLATYSEDFDNAAWAKTRSTVTANSTTAPDGTTTADTLVEDGTINSSHFVTDTIAFPDTSNYVLSVWLKAANRTWVAFQTGAPVLTQKTTWFDLSTGVVGTTSHYDAGIEDWGDGWFRCWIKVTPNSAGNGVLLIVVAEADNDYFFDGLSQDSLYMWGAQTEAGSYPTSYIPTSGSTASRSYDILRYKGDDGNVVNNQQGTIVFDYLLPDVLLSTNSWAFMLDDGGTNTNVISIYTPTTGKITAATVTDSVMQVSLTEASSTADGVKHTVRYTYKANEAKLYVDDVLEGTDTECTIPDDLDRMYIGHHGPYPTGDIRFRGLISNIKIFKKPTLK